MNGKIDQRLRVTLAQMEVFVATARAGSTRRGAERVARSQSAASAALADLEATLGTTLFDRSGRRLLLNENGQALLPLAVALIEQAGDIEGFFEEGQPTTLRIASSFTVGEYLLPQLIAGWKAGNPNSRVRLDIANTTDVLAAVAAFDVDVGFIEGSGSHPDLTIRRWRSDELIIVAGRGHPVSARVVTSQQLGRVTWILREHGSGSREVADRWLSANLPSYEVGLELGSNEAVKRAVAAGLGIGCLSRHAVAEALSQGWLIEVKTRLPAIKRSLSLVLHRAKRPGKTAAGFVRHCLA